MPRSEATTPDPTTPAAGSSARGDAPTEALGGELLGVPRLPWSEQAEVRLPFVEVPAPREPVTPQPSDPEPALRPGDVLGGKYEVLGCLAHGGLGWVYLARDLELDGMHVAVKGMIDPADTRLADAERRVLTALHHPNIVRIFGNVRHADPYTGQSRGYLVMEYVAGLSLRELLRRLAAGEEVFGEPLRAEHVIGYAQELLDALHYLHGQGLLYCDLKPDNVIHGGHRVTLIDLGATRRVGDDSTPLAFTRRYQVGEDELRDHGVTVRADLHTLGRTLTELLDASADAAARPGDGGTGFGVRSLRHALDRATAAFPQRFASAADMAATLDGVLREIQSLRDGEARPAPSAVFAETTALLDAGLGTVPALDRWTARPARQYRPPLLAPGLPSPAAAAVLLPPPRIDQADVAAAFLADLRSPDARRLLGQLSGVPWQSAELSLTRCRAHLDLADPARAWTCLAEAEAALGDAAEHDWRLAWHRGLVSLAATGPTAAEACFDRVYRALPGEAAPKLALGYCAEYQGRATEAAEFYRAVWLRDRSQAGAAFGLARLRLAEGDRPGAVAALDQVPDVSLHAAAARIAAVRVLAGRLPAGLPSVEDLRQAFDRLPTLSLDDEETPGWGPTRDRLTTEVREVALEKAGQLRQQQRERRLRLLLEQSFHALTRQARDPDSHGVLIDLAHAVRPRTRL
ncbi:tetratricopeptide repeat protein [Prauserella muralis]|uniref:non-specific serine/threonine protein kinase n=1 Tax=Prauserella muralis TaxID=588067 RepID=A0A2V4ANI7_9PSEU|nr:tetratricopeptide repeat protein [Prauserella muralis]PXY22266.1 hypothetical protein BAY60_20520 [Prauserella muralis]TWE27906.1 serine/threonine-protein kinase PknG [Prauserella muralis]